ncbi:MAG: DUF3853 family protein [Bacteroides sp.]
MEAISIDLDRPLWQLTAREFLELNKQSAPLIVEQRTQKKQQIITGVPALSKELNVSETTLHEWKAKGYLDGSFSQIDRTILFDLDKVLECIKHKPNRKPKRGRYSRR